MSRCLASGPPQKVGERVTRVTPVAKGPVEALLSSLNLGPQQGLDPEPDNIVAVGTFTSTPPGQPPQQVWGSHCMLPCGSDCMMPCGSDCMMPCGSDCVLPCGSDCMLPD